MASIKYTNNAKTTLAADINNSVTSATVADGSVFPSLSSGEHFYCTFDDGTNNEIVKVTARSSNTLTIVRAQDNTSARAFSDGDKAELRITAVVLEEVSTSTSSWGTNIFAGDGSDTTFTLSQAATNENYLQVFIDGVFQAHNTYSVSGTTLTFATAPANGRVITAYHVEPVNLGTADTITATANNSTDETVYPTFVDGATGTQGLETDTGLTYNPSSGLLTISGELDAGSLDISGNADIDGTLEADAITVNGVTLAETIADTVGAMVSSNTETGIAVSYDDADNTLDFVVGTLNQDTTGLAATATALATARTIHGVSFDGTANIDLSEVISDTVGAMFSSNTETGITATYQDGDNTIDLVIGTLNQDTTGTAATVTGAAQSNITSLGTLTTLTVDNVIVNGTTIGHTDDTDLMTLADGVLTVAGEVDAASLDISGDADIDGTLEADAITVDGTALNEYIADTVGAMVGSNTESGITVAYQDGDNTLDFTVGTLNQDTTGSAATLTTARTIGGVSFDGSANITPTTFATASFSGVVTAATSAKITQVAITSSSNAVAWDAAAAANAYHVTTENTTFSAPSNAVEGAIISVELAQGGTARTIAWNTVFEFAASTAPTVTATANKTDIFSFRYNGSVWQEIGRVQNMAQT